MELIKMKVRNKKTGKILHGFFISEEQALRTFSSAPGHHTSWNRKNIEVERENEEMEKE